MTITKERLEFLEKVSSLDEERMELFTITIKALSEGVEGAIERGELLTRWINETPGYGQIAHADKKRIFTAMLYGEAWPEDLRQYAPREVAV